MKCIKCGKREALQRNGKQYLLCGTCGMRAIFNFCYDLPPEPVVPLTEREEKPWQAILDLAPWLAHTEKCKVRVVAGHEEGCDCGLQRAKEGK